MAITTPTEIQGLRVACINVRGIINNPNKRQQLHQWLVVQRIDIVLLQEVCVHHNNPNANFPGICNDSISSNGKDPSEFEFICADFTERIKYCGISELGVHKHHQRNKDCINS